MNITQLLTQTQEECFEMLLNVTQDFSQTYSKNEYIIVNTNNMPKPMLCIHLDTTNGHSGVNKEDTHIEGSLITLKSTSKNKCLGGDDRAGLWIALQLIKSMQNGYIPKDKYSFGFFCDEEVGGLGSTAYLNSKHFKEHQHTCFIGLDRRNTQQGTPEMALYGCNNENLISLFKGAYETHYGSFTDASNLAEGTSLACINLSVGYNNEHTREEYINFRDTLFTFKYLKDLEISKEQFKADYINTYNDEPICCEMCGEHTALYLTEYEYGWELKLCQDCLSFMKTNLY